MPSAQLDHQGENMPNYFDIAEGFGDAHQAMVLGTGRGVRLAAARRLAPPAQAVPRT